MLVSYAQCYKCGGTVKIEVIREYSNGYKVYGSDCEHCNDYATSEDDN